MIHCSHKRRFFVYFLVDEEVVVVTLNYRLIPFSFLSLESPTLPGNQGLKASAVPSACQNSSTLTKFIFGDWNSITSAYVE
jgi:hypothetical protein